MAPFGVLIVDKPAGVTSRDVVDRIERLVRPAKAGHAGTLDPLATGVLVICVGQATRLIRFVQQMRKQYQATFLLGRQSETDDIEKDVIAIPDAVEPTRALLDHVLPRFVGEIQQRPPAHSAIKIAGRRAYKLARKGADFELAARTVTIHQIDVRRYEYPELELAIECGSGTYIRARPRHRRHAGHCSRYVGVGADRDRVISRSAVDRNRTSIARDTNAKFAAWTHRRSSSAIVEIDRGPANRNSSRAADRDAHW